LTPHTTRIPGCWAIQASSFIPTTTAVHTISSTASVTELNHGFIASLALTTVNCNCAMAGQPATTELESP
jgi:hypothetical protein